MEIIACSGPGAGAAIAESIAVGFTHAGIAAMLLIASLVIKALISRGVWVPLICAVSLVFHPAWTIGATSGDCGYTLHVIARLITVLLGVLVTMQALHALMRRRKTAASALEP